MHIVLRVPKIIQFWWGVHFSREWRTCPSMNIEAVICMRLDAESKLFNFPLLNLRSSVTFFKMRSFISVIPLLNQKLEYQRLLILRALVNTVMNFQFLYNLSNSCLDKTILASHERIFCIYFHPELFLYNPLCISNKGGLL
jgi:hypothetical protein